MNISGDFFVTLLQFFIILGILLFTHEFGHYIVARLCGVQIEEFGFGFPPRLVKLFRWGGTDFTLNWIPFGAFVRPRGENDPNVPGGLAAASPWVRLGVLLGGPVLNIVLGILVFSAMFMRIGAPNTDVVQVIEVIETSPAALAGLLPGDVILDVNGESIDSTDELHNLIQANLGKPVEITYQRDGQALTQTVTPRANPPEGQGPMGIVMGNPYEPVTVLEALPAATVATYEQARQFMLLPVRLLRGQTSSEENRIVGPKGMFDIYQEARRRDTEATASPIEQPAVNVLLIVGSISIALGLTNLLPIPALDGGRILFVLPEILLRRRVPQQYENLVHLVGFAALLLLMSYVTIQDFTNPIMQP
jgi:regulator of sigma E protease